MSYSFLQTAIKKNQNNNLFLTMLVQNYIIHSTRSLVGHINTYAINTHKTSYLQAKGAINILHWADRQAGERALKIYFCISY